MSLIISLKIPDAIIVSSDSNMTIETMRKSDGNVLAMSHTAHTPKMVIFRKRLAVTYCGDMSVTDSISVLQFLQDLRLTVPRNITPELLADTILNKYKKISKRDTIFLISGYIGNNSSIYRVTTGNENIEECLSSGYGAVYNGQTEYIHGMMSSVAAYKNISIKDGIELITTMMYCISSISKFWKSQSVGGDIDIYLMCRDKKTKSGWVEYGQYIPISEMKKK